MIHSFAYLQPSIHIGAGGGGISVHVFLVFSHVVNIGEREDGRAQDCVVFILNNDLVLQLEATKELLLTASAKVKVINLRKAATLDCWSS